MYTALRLTAIFSLLLNAAANPIGSAAVLSSTDSAAGSSSGAVKIPLNIHDTRQYSDDLETKQEWLRQQSQGLRQKYGGRLDEAGQALARREREEEMVRLSKRASGTSTLLNSGTDASYSGQVSVGTPAQNFYLIFDTGSADMWVAGQECTSSSCRSTQLFDSSASSTFSNTGDSFEITYGSGNAAGTEAKDTVTIAGFTVPNQEFGVVNQTSANVIRYPLSGILGLAFESIAQTQAPPFWEAVMTSGQATEQTMGFFMKRYRGDLSASVIEPDGGEFSLGSLDTSKYTGNINYVSISTANRDYWRIPTQAITVQGSVVSGLTNRESVIDTGTTLIGAPTADVEAIYRQISGAREMDASTGYSGYWEYPCSTTVNVTLQYGGLSYAISNADFNLGSFTRDTSMCTGAIFEMNLGRNQPIEWIVGASFLKNVYSVFRYDPFAIGFAQLADGTQNVSNGTVVAGTTTGGGTTGSGSGSGSGNSTTGGTSGGGTTGSGAGRGSVVSTAVVVLGAVGAIVMGCL